MPAVTIPNKNPEHAAVKSNATVLVVHPTAEAMEGASPNKSSGEEVAQMTRWMSEGEIPDISIAFLAAAVGIERSRFM
jgi:hypothetical protein